jgi:hypothetical protein
MGAFGAIPSLAAGRSGHRRLHGGPSARLFAEPDATGRASSPPLVRFGIRASSRRFVETTMAEGVGFEPTMGYSPMLVFKTSALNRSATPP